MDFDLSQEQRMLQDSVSRYVAEHAPLDTVRACGEGADTTPLWQAFVEMGVLGAAIPEAVGGLGLGLLDAALVQEQLGAGVAPVEHTAQVVAGLALARYGHTDGMDALLQGEQRYALALAHCVQRREGTGIRSSNGALDGMSLFVQGANTATHILVGDDAGRLWRVDAGNANIEPLATIDVTRSVAEVRFDGAKAELLDEGGDAVATLLNAARVLLAADTLGAAQHALDAAVAYSMEREQFGRVIGSFQAVKHLCAEMAAALEPARSLLWYAAHTYDSQSDEFNLHACHAKAHIDEVGRFVARTATEVHGGMGFTDLLGLHYWFKRIGANRQLLGGPEVVRELAAQEQGW